MPHHKRKFTSVLSTVLGAAAAFFGVRWLRGWFERRSLEQERQQRVLRRMSQPSMGSSHQPQDQPDRRPVPATGPSPAASASVTEAAPPPNIASAANQGSPTVEVQVMVSPLAQYLLAFHDMIEQLRTRQRDSDQPGGRALTDAERAGYQETLDRLEEQIPDYGLGNLPNDSLQERIYRLMVKVRDALQDRSYGADDLFRINGEVRSEVCRMLAEIQWAGADNSPDFEQVRQVYDCG